MNRKKLIQAVAKKMVMKGGLGPAKPMKLNAGPANLPGMTRRPSQGPNYLGARYQRGKGKRTRLKKLGIVPGSDISWGA